MTELKLFASQSVRTLFGEERQVIEFKISNLEGRFALNSEDYTIRVRVDIDIFESFASQLSKNGKIVLAYFTSDSFDSLTSTSGSVYLLNGNRVVHEFENFDFTSDINSLSSLYALIGAPLGDNAWLSSVS